MTKRSERQMLFGSLVVAIIVIPLGIWIFAEAPPRVPQDAVTTDAQWQAALSNGDGHDWVSLSDRDEMALCLAAAEVLGKDDAVAWEYRMFLGTFYENPDTTTRSRPISETISVCQSLIDNGTVRVDR